MLDFTARTVYGRGMREPAEITVCARVTADEAAGIDAMAKAKGQTRSDYIRAAVGLPPKGSKT